MKVRMDAPPSWTSRPRTLSNGPDYGDVKSGDVKPGDVKSGDVNRDCKSPVLLMQPCCLCYRT